MAASDAHTETVTTEARYLEALEQLLAIRSTDLDSALFEVAQCLARLTGAEKVDVFLLERADRILVARGTSDTPMGRKQKALMLDRLPLDTGGRTAVVFKTGTSFLIKDAAQDPEELPAMVDALGIRSNMGTPLQVAGECRGVLMVASSKVGTFSRSHLTFLETISHWVGSVAERAELTERIAAEAIQKGRQAAAEELITVLAHDLRNHLSPLASRVELIQRRARREHRERDVQDTERLSASLNRLNQMISDMMDAARLDEGLFALDQQPLDLVTLVQETAEVMRTSLTDIQVEAPVELSLLADPDRIRQALENLIGNAVKHAQEGTPVRVQIQPLTGTGELHQAQIRIENQGRGVPSELLPRLFSRFSAGPGSSGLGLGLYLARRIAEAHGGTVVLDGGWTAGARFCLTLPVRGR